MLLMYIQKGRSVGLAWLGAAKNSQEFIEANVNKLNVNKLNVNLEGQPPTPNTTTNQQPSIANCQLMMPNILDILLRLPATFANTFPYLRSETRAS